jgi:catechol 2,3-dioxygenase-like lactoylglutathione lyase family enzyme
MITSLDHAVLLCPDIEMGTAVYGALLGCEADWRAASEGMATAIFRTANTSLELIAPDGEGAIASKLRSQITDEGPGLKSLVFATQDIAEAHHRLARRGLEPSDIIAGTSTDLRRGTTRGWKRLRLRDALTHGVKTFLIERSEALAPPAAAASGAVTRLDHIVIDTPNPERALAHYGARLGLDLALDRTNDEWKTRFLFFRTGGLTLEVIHRLGEPGNFSGPDKIWGLTWEVSDLAAAHARLADSGLDVSSLRKGRKPGSTVFTVRDGTLGVPTLFIAHETR